MQACDPRGVAGVARLLLLLLLLLLLFPIIVIVHIVGLPSCIRTAIRILIHQTEVPLTSALKLVIVVILGLKRQGRCISGRAAALH